MKQQKKINKNETQMRLFKQDLMISLRQDYAMLKPYIKTLYLLYRSAYGHHTWPDGNLH